MDEKKLENAETLESMETKQPEETRAKKANRLTVHLILPVFFAVMAVVWICIGLTKFGFFDRLMGGTPAFLPVICATVMLLACIVEVVNILVNGCGDEKPKLSWMCMAFFLLCGGIVGMSYLIGLLPAMLIFVFVWLKVIEKSTWKSTIFVTLLNTAIGYGVFQFALGVPFPEGLLFQMIFG